MINYTENIEIINSFLKNFNVTITEILPFQKFLIFDKIGFLDYSLMYDRAEINYIFVYEEYRNNKIASKLLDSMIDDLKNNNCLSVTLEVNENNISAIKFYEKNGFKNVATRKKYYHNEDGFLMIREMV